MEMMLQSIKILLLVKISKRATGARIKRREKRIKAANFVGWLNEGSMAKNLGGIAETTIQNF